MKDQYIQAFYDIVCETKGTHGYELPVELESYIVFLLASHIDKPDFLPQDSFAESLLKLKEPFTLNAKELGDT